GERYIDPWINDPADCCDPCDQCGNYNGQSCGECRPVFSAVASLWGYRYDGGCGEGCNSCCGFKPVVAQPACLCGNGGCDGGGCCGGCSEPSCGFEPACGCESSCSCGASCGCGTGMGDCGCGGAGNVNGTMVLSGPVVVPGQSIAVPHSPTYASPRPTAVLPGGRRAVPSTTNRVTKNRLEYDAAAIGSGNDVMVKESVERRPIRPRRSKQIFQARVAGR
ncbi:MAG: hypothetical protein AAFN70_06110, partial [Planctomycetota bacterium]